MPPSCFHRSLNGYSVPYGRSSFLFDDKRLASLDSFGVAVSSQSALAGPRTAGWHNLSSRNHGSTAAQLAAFKFSGLLEDRALFTRLTNPDTRNETLSSLLREHYAGLSALPLETASVGQVNKWFSENATSNHGQGASLLPGPRKTGRS